MLTAIRRSFLTIVLVLSGLAAASAGTEDPRSFIDRLGRDATEVLSPSQPVPERQAALEALFHEAFDFDTISRLVLGRHWQGATPEQRAAYQEAFADFVAQTYSRRLSDNVIDSFAITDVRRLDDRDTLVQTTIEQPGEPRMTFGWRVRRTDEGLKLIDVVVDGVSLVVSKRSEFASVVRREGMDRLIQALREQAATARGPAAPTAVS